MNPFEKRATEYLRDDEAFLSVVTPEPLSTFFGRPAKEDKLFDRLVMLIGSPGSGKTTMTRLFQLPLITTLLRNQSLDSHKDMLLSLEQCGVIRDGRPRVVGARIPLESEYREFWEFPYPDELKLSLMTALLQARAVITWIYNIQSAGADLDEVRIVARESSDAAISAMGGLDAAGALRSAQEVEMSIYRISAALVPPAVETLADQRATAAYRPFDVIDQIEVTLSGERVRLRPLIIFDDAHSLHPEQFELFRRWLLRRELKVARWIVTRLDALAPHQVLLAPELSSEREITYIRMQNDGRRLDERRAFRRMAKDMSSRYLGRIEHFNRRRLTQLSAMLSTEPPRMPARKLESLSRRTDAVQDRCRVSPARRAEFETMIDDHANGSINEDVRLASLSILMERYFGRTRAQTVPLDLFAAGMDESDLEPSRPLTMDSGIIDAAQVHLMHAYQRPYFFGFNMVCDASTENAEQFLHIASDLVTRLETRLIRGKTPTLTAEEQDHLLRSRATDMLRQWNFPHAAAVRNLVGAIADQCVTKSLEGNASLKGGAVAFGVPQSEFESIPSAKPELARILQFAVAYNAVNLVQEHRAKNQSWCLIELGGTVLLKHGLTLTRGGFLERTVKDLELAVEESRHG